MSHTSLKIVNGIKALKHKKKAKFETVQKENATYNVLSNIYMHTCCTQSYKYLMALKPWRLKVKMSFKKITIDGFVYMRKTYS